MLTRCRNRAREPAASGELAAAGGVFSPEGAETEGVREISARGVCGIVAEDVRHADAGIAREASGSLGDRAGDGGFDFVVRGRAPGIRGGCVHEEDFCAAWLDRRKGEVRGRALDGGAAIPRRCAAIQRTACVDRARREEFVPAARAAMCGECPLGRYLEEGR